eukprot:SAG31_NODE_2191_length_6228_cov_2.962806_3_plen_780_part_00
MFPYRLLFVAPTYCTDEAVCASKNSENFETGDLFEQKNLKQVLICIHSLGRAAKRIKDYDGPTLGGEGKKDANSKTTSKVRSLSQNLKIGLGPPPPQPGSMDWIAAEKHARDVHRQVQATAPGARNVDDSVGTEQLDTRNSELFSAALPRGTHPTSSRAKPTKRNRPSRRAGRLIRDMNAEGVDTDATTMMADEDRLSTAQFLRMPAELAMFLETFCAHRHDADSKAARKRMWSAWDSNGNGMLSLAEVDRAVKETLEASHGSDGEQLWERYRPSYIRAFTDASDAVPDKKIQSGTNLTGDDVVTKREFRVLQSYLRLYATMYEVFAMVDGEGAGVTSMDDRKIVRKEWEDMLGMVVAAGNSWAPFAALQGATAGDFGVVNSGGHGAIMLSEFCAWVVSAEKAAGTATGVELAIGDADHVVAAEENAANCIADSSASKSLQTKAQMSSEEETLFDDGLVGHTMIAVKAPPIRAGIDDKSARRGNLKKGEKFVVLETASTVDGVERLRMERGWISRKSKAGDDMVQLDVSVPRQPVAVEPHQQQHERSPVGEAITTDTDALAPGSSPTEASGDSSTELVPHGGSDRDGLDIEASCDAAESERGIKSVQESVVESSEASEAVEALLDDGLVGHTMVAVKAPPIRAGIDDKSARRGNLKKGEKFVVLETASTVDGVERLRMERGWISRKSKAGDDMVQLDVSVPRQPVAVEPHQQQHERSPVGEAAKLCATNPREGAVEKVQATTVASMQSTEDSNTVAQMAHLIMNQYGQNSRSSQFLLFC